MLGCGACHPGAPAPGQARSAAPDLVGLSDRWSAEGLAAYLEEPAPLARAMIARMPDFHLSSAEAAAVTMHLLRTDRSRRTRSELAELGRTHPNATAERGAAIVAALNCAGCHAGAGAEPWAPGPPIAGIVRRVRRRWLAGYLTSPRAIRPFGYYPGTGSRMPDFDLSGAEVDSLVVWLAGTGGAPPVDDSVAASRPPADARSAFGLAKAEALLTDHLSCLGCHSLDGEGGRVAPKLDGVGSRLKPEYLRAVVTAPARAAPGTIMPQPLQDSVTIELIIGYLRQRESSTPAAAYLSLIETSPSRPELSPRRDPAALYARYCAACHGPAGGGDGFNAAHLPSRPTRHADADYMRTRPDATLFDGIHAGGHTLGKSHRMPAWGGTLSATEIRGLVGYLRQLCGCEQPAWAAAP